MALSPGYSPNSGMIRGKRSPFKSAAVGAVYSYVLYVILSEAWQTWVAFRVGYMTSSEPSTTSCTISPSTLLVGAFHILWTYHVLAICYLLIWTLEGSRQNWSTNYWTMYLLYLLYSFWIKFTIICCLRYSAKYQVDFCVTLDVNLFNVASLRPSISQFHSGSSFSGDQDRGTNEAWLVFSHYFSKQWGYQIGL